MPYHAFCLREEVPFQWDRPRAAFSSWNNSDTHSWFLQRGAIRISLCRCSLTRLSTWGRRATGGGNIAQKSRPFVGQGIRSLCKKDWAAWAVFGGKEVYSSSAKDFPNYLNHERVESPFLWRDSSSTCLTGTYIAFSERRLFWAHTRRSFASAQSRFETRPPWCFMYDTTDLLSERTSTWCPCMSGRKNWQAWDNASISRQLV